MQLPAGRSGLASQKIAVRDKLRAHSEGAAAAAIVAVIVINQPD